MVLSFFKLLELPLYVEKENTLAVGTDTSCGKIPPDYIQTFSLNTFFLSLKSSAPE